MRIKDISKNRHEEKEFLTVITLIKNAKYKALLCVNAELIKLYWDIGKLISEKIKNSEWGDGVINDLAVYISRCTPGLKGFNRRGLFRMTQFYNAYKDNEKLSSLMMQISWSNHLLILSKTKSIEEKEFYLLLSIKERYSKRELERQINSGVFERQMISHKKVSPLATQLHKDIATCFKDTYVLDFLDLPNDYSEKDLQAGLVENFKHFLLEFGKDFSFIAQEYRISVGKNDYYS